MCAHKLRLLERNRISEIYNLCKTDAVNFCISVAFLEIQHGEKIDRNSPTEISQGREFIFNHNGSKFPHMYIICVDLGKSKSAKFGKFVWIVYR